MTKPDTTKPATRKKHARFLCLIALLCCLMLLTAYATIASRTLDNGTFEQEKARAQKLPPLTDDWKNILKENDLSDFERTVLTRAVKTGKISRADYEHAYSKYRQCMASRGYRDLRYERQPDGLYKQTDSASMTAADFDAYMDASNACSQGTISIIEAEYRDQQDNPERYKDQSIVAVQCLRDAGKVDDSYTALHFDTALAKTDKGLSGDNYSKLFGFPVHSSDERTLFCLSRGGLSLSGDF